MAKNKSSKSLSKGFVEKLREAYSKIERIDPEGEGYNRLVTFMDERDEEELKLLVEADIKWVTSLARNRLLKMELASR